MDRRTFIGTFGGVSLFCISGCTGQEDDEPAVQDSDGDGVIDTEDYAPHDPEVQNRADLAGSANITTAGPTPADTPEPTPADTPEPTPAETTEPTPSETPEQTPTETVEPTPTETCSVVVDDKVTKKGGEAAIYDADIEGGGDVTVEIKEIDGKSPILEVVGPEGSSIIDNVSNQTIRETFEAPKSGEYSFEVRNGAMLDFQEGTWEVTVEVCTGG